MGIVKGVYNNGKKVVLCLFGQIGKEIDGNVFAATMRNYYDQGAKDQTILINSIGGSVFHGYSIVGMIDQLQKEGANITTKNIGAAYSMAGVIFLSAKKRIALDYSQTMIHDPYFTDESKEELSDSDKKMIADIKSSLELIIANNCGQNKEKISSLMSAETFLNAVEASNLGMCKVEYTGKTIEIEDKYKRVAACLNMYNENNGEKMINSLLKLNAEASQEAQVEAVKNLIEKTNKVDTLTNELTVANNKIAKLESENKELKKAEAKVKAETLIAKAIEEGKITEDSKAIWIEDAIENFEKAEARLNSFVVKSESINAQLSKGGNDKEKALAAKYAEIIDKKDYKQLNSLSDTEKEAMIAAFEKFNKINVTIEN